MRRSRACPYRTRTGGPATEVKVETPQVDTVQADETRTGETQTGEIQVDETQADETRTVEQSAIRLLARREHSTQELRRKLERKGYPAELVGTIVDRLSGKRLVSDERYVASQIRHRALRGQGPVRIRAELRQQGISDTQIQEAFDHVDLAAGGPVQDLEAIIDWVALAGRVRLRKFGARAPRDVRERAKQARFLQYRGFTAEQIRIALDQDPEFDIDPDREGSGRAEYGGEGAGSEAHDGEAGIWPDDDE